MWMGDFSWRELHQTCLSHPYSPLAGGILATVGMEVRGREREHRRDKQASGAPGVGHTADQSGQGSLQSMVCSGETWRGADGAQHGLLHWRRGQPEEKSILSLVLALWKPNTCSSTASKLHRMSLSTQICPYPCCASRSEASVSSWPAGCRPGLLVCSIQMLSPYYAAPRSHSQSTGPGRAEQCRPAQISKDKKKRKSDQHDVSSTTQELVSCWWSVFEKSRSVTWLQGNSSSRRLEKQTQHRRHVYCFISGHIKVTRLETEL